MKTNYLKNLCFNFTKQTKLLSTKNILMMQHCLLAFVLFVGLSINSKIIAQSAISESYAILSLNGGANTNYDMQASTASPDFQGGNLGTFTPCQSLIIKGGQNKTSKCGGCNITGGVFNYRVYLTSTPSGTFIPINMSLLSNDAGGCGGNQTWEGSSGATNIISSLTTAGNYTIEVYSEAAFNSCPSAPVAGINSSNNSGANYKATFNFTGNFPSAVMSGSATICQSLSTDIAVAITGGTSPYTLVYAATVGGTGGTITGYTSGTNISVTPTSTSTYTITSVTDANGCTPTSRSGNAVITVNARPSAATISGVATICAGGSANLVVNITGGASPYTVIYLGTGGGAAGTVNNYTSGANISVSPNTNAGYTLDQVIDANGCTVASPTGSATITVNSSPTSAVLSGNSAVCNGSSTNLRVNITSGTPPFTVVYAGGGGGTVTNYASGTNIPVSPTVNTTYTLTSVTDSRMCTVALPTGTVNVTVNPSVASATLSGGATICQGNSTNLSVAIVGGTAPFTVVYDDGGLGGTVTNYTSGSNIPVSPTGTTTYSLVSVTDATASACTPLTPTGTALVTVNPRPSAGVISGTATICNGFSTNLSVAITGGASPYTVVYSGGTLTNYVSGTNISVSPTSTTTYTLTSITDANGCTVAIPSGTATVTVNPKPSAATLSGTANICNGGSTNLSVAITGGTSPYTVVYSGGTITNYVSGTNISVSPSTTTAYTLTSVTDANNCTVTTPTGTATVTVNPVPTITLGTVANVMNTAISFIIPYTATTNSPDQYSLVTVAPSMLPSFTPITDATLTGTSGNLTIPIPATIVGTYNFNLTVKNATANCPSIIVSFTLTIQSNTIYVRKDGNDANDGMLNTSARAKLTVQNGANTVIDGGTVVVDAGTYAENATITNKSFSLQGVGNPIIQGLIMNGAGKTITLTGAISISEILSLQAGDIITNGNLSLLSSATKQAMVINSGMNTITGNVTVQKYFRPNSGITSTGYRFLSSPITAATFNGLGISVTVNPAYNASATPGTTRPFPTVYFYNPSLAGAAGKSFQKSPTPEFDKGWQSPNAATDNLIVGKGYTINTDANNFISVTGTLNNTPVGNISVPVSTNASALNWNLVGNPYPSPILWTAIRALSTNTTNVADEIQLYIPSGQYQGNFVSRVAGISSSMSDLTPNEIAVMQGFFVRATAVGNLVMDNSVRVTSFSNPNSYRTEENEKGKHEGIIRLKISNAKNEFDETVVYFNEKATSNFDNQFDAHKFQLNSGTIPSIYSTDNKELYSINALQNLTDDVTIPLTVNVGLAGTQKIALLQQEGFKRKVELYLLDKTTNTFYDLSKPYEFTGSKGVIADRFFLLAKPQFTDSELNGDILNAYPNPATEVLNISLGDEYKGELKIRLTDVVGRELWTEIVVKTTKIYETTVNLSDKASGTYILEVQGKIRTVKKIVKQ